MTADYDAPRKQARNSSSDSIEELNVQQTQQQTSQVDEDEARVTSPGVVPPENWEKLAGRYADTAEVIGVDREKHLFAIGSPLRYPAAFRSIDHRQELPEPLTVAEVDAFAAEIGDPPRARWE